KRAPDNNIYFTHQGGVGIPLGHSRIENTDAPGLASNVNVYALSYSYANGQTPWPGMALPNVIVTVKKDSVQRSFSQSACGGNNILSAQDLSGNHYIWHDGFIGSTRNDITSSGTYWVSYIMNGCARYTDSLHV